MAELTLADFAAALQRWNALSREEQEKRAAWEKHFQSQTKTQALFAATSNIEPSGGMSTGLNQLTDGKRITLFGSPSAVVMCSATSVLLVGEAIAPLAGACLMP